MKRLLSSVLFSAIIYFLPVLPQSSLLLNIGLWVPFILSILIFYTQPALQVSHAVAEKKADRGTVFLILITGMLGLIIAVCEWAYVRPHSISLTVVSWIGLVMMVFGFVFRYWAIHTLGKFFTPTVKVQDNQSIITQGPYARLRHPSYLGAYLFMLGVSVWLNSYVAFLLIAISMFGVYRKRILAEESFLTRNFGEIYRRYQEHTSRLFPGIW